MNYYPRVYEERLNADNPGNFDRNDPGRIQENTNVNPRNTGAIGQRNLPRNDNSNDLAFERNVGEETNLQGNANQNNRSKIRKEINEIY